jgi:hypothetical protein
MRARVCCVLLAASAIAACSQSVPATPTAPTTAMTHAAPVATAPEPAPPPVTATPAPPSEAIVELVVDPPSIRGSVTAVGTVTLSAPAPAGGTVISLSSDFRDVRPPATVTVPAGNTSASFLIPTSEPHEDTPVRITATGDGSTRTIEIMLTLTAPGARTDEYTIPQGGTLVVPSPGILDNDARRSGHDLIAELVMGPMSGTLTLLAEGGFTYRPHTGFSGRDRFIYRPLDGKTYGNQQHVWITVTGVTASVPTAPGTQTFIFTGGQQNFIVPAGVTQITIEASGAQGGAGGAGGTAGANGGFVAAKVFVTPGESLAVFVGGQGGPGGNGAGTAGFNGGGGGGMGESGALTGGGGGGASDVRQGGIALANRIVVAGGGGGSAPGGSPPIPGGVGGGLVAGNGGNGVTLGEPGGAGFCCSAGGGGAGGSQVPGAAGGVPGGHPDSQPGSAGAVGIGGAGGGIGGGGGIVWGGGGGGGGFNGGGGGGSAAFARPGAGGGGSSFTIPGAANVTHQQGVRSGNGTVVIRW